LLSFGRRPALWITSPNVGFDGKTDLIATTLTLRASPFVTSLCRELASRSERMGDLPGIPSARLDPRRGADDE